MDALLKWKVSKRLLLSVSMILDKSFFMSLKLFINTTYECMHTVNI